MERLFIEATEETPEVSFDAEQNKFSISGRSLPEDSVAFYQPIFAWIEQFTSEASQDVDFEFFMEYFNTSSAKQIAKILVLLEKLNENVFVQVIWKYHTGDTDMMESGMRFSKLLDIEFELREVE